MKTAGSCLTVRDIRELLFRMEYTWKHGKGPGTIPATLPADSSTRQ